jgi:putative peptide zinc metalloprotease protein
MGSWETGIDEVIPLDALDRPTPSGDSRPEPKSPPPAMTAAPPVPATEPEPLRPEAPAVPSRSAPSATDPADGLPATAAESRTQATPDPGVVIAGTATFTASGRTSRLTAADISEDRLLRAPSSPPTLGWRKAVHKMSGGLLTPAPSRAEQEERERIATLKTPVRGSRVIATVSTKGGVGKTTTTVNLGHTFASHRGDRVVALDGNPDAGSLGYRIRLETPATADDLLNGIDGVTRYADMRAFTSQAMSRLEVVAAPDDPRVSNALGERDYRRLIDLLEHHYQLILVDCGTGILDDATRGIVEEADQLVVVTAPSVDAARATSFLLDWLEKHDHGDLVANAVAVVNGCRSGRGLVDLDEVEAHFAERCRTVVRVPWDGHLAAGATTGLDLISAEARDAYIRLAAAVAEGFTSRTDKEEAR